MNWVQLVGWIAAALAIGTAAGVILVRRSRGTLRPLPESKLSQVPQRPQDGQPEQPIPTVPPELVQACAGGDCIVFLGSGVGAQVGLPTWTELLNLIVSRTAPDGDRSRLADTAGALEGRPSLQAELIRENVPQSELLAFLRETFDRRISGLPAACRILGQIPFTGVLTATWDPLPEAIFTTRAPRSLTLADEEELTRRFRENRFTILRLYGDLRRQDTVLFTPSELSRTLYDNPAQTRTVLSMFLTRTIFFVGLSLDGIESIMDAFPTHFEPGSRSHFALVPWGTEAIAREQVFSSRYGIRILPYVASPQHPELATFLSELNTQVSRTAPPASPPSVRMAKLNGVRLENIGPFRHLELDFEAGWTVLIGNNGRGKSTLIRAIALGICGDDGRAEPAGARLLRAGARKGTIELQIGGNNYRTDLVKDQKRVIARSQQITPLQAGTWVVLGFPPLRGLPAGRPTGTSEGGFPSPTVDDLLPLLSSAVDDRLANIKQWIVDLEEGQRGRGKERIKAFFRLINQLTPGVTFDYAGLSEDKDVMVHTDDGVIPMDLVSQGTSSILNWCGTLLQRMYEIYPASKSPQMEPAVVLIDEVDAHMHPEWQRMFVALMEQHFPRLQVIATTHSPLVVGNLEAGHVVAMRRSQGNVLAEVVPVGMRGWDADDILTGLGFDMDTSREPETAQLEEEYAQLFAKSPRTREEDERLKEVADQLAPRIGQTLLPKGQAEALFTEWLDARWKEHPPERRQRLLRESRLYMAQLADDDEEER